MYQLLIDYYGADHEWQSKIPAYGPPIHMCSRRAPYVLIDDPIIADERRKES